DFRAMRVFGLLAAVLLCATACGGASANQPATSAADQQGPINPVAVSDSDFAGHVERLLVNGQPTRERNDLLAGVVQHQLRRSGERFSSGHTEAGIRALNGAFYLMRAGELRVKALECCPEALRHGAREAARVGNEGRASALYTMLDTFLPEGSQKRDVRGHLDAMRDFKRATRSNGK